MPEGEAEDLEVAHWRDFFGIHLLRYKATKGHPEIDLLPAKSLRMKTALVIHDDNCELKQESIADSVLYRDTLYETLPLLVIGTNSSRKYILFL
jgi:hypothetical protein